MVHYSLAHLCCSRAICRKASRVYCEDWQVHSRATCFCWQVLRRSPNYIQRSCMVYSWNQSSAESLFCAWTMVCLMFWKVNINVLISSLTKFSVLPALSLHNGIIHCDIVEGSFCTETFYSFIEASWTTWIPIWNRILWSSWITAKIINIQRFWISFTRGMSVYYFLHWQYLIYVIQRNEVRVSSTILPWFQSHWACVFGHEISPSSQWCV